jgi:hypothetical protein
MWGRGGKSRSLIRFDGFAVAAFSEVAVATELLGK